MIKRLRELQDEGYRDFSLRLLPGTPKEKLIGVRIPRIRELARELEKKDPRSAEIFVEDLPHTYHEGNLLHGFLIGELKDPEELFCRLEEFLPYMDNRAVTDSFLGRVLKPYRKTLIRRIPRWPESEHPYTVRFGIKMLQDHFLDEEFKEEYLTAVAGIRREEYYIRMMIARYFSTAPAKQYDAAIRIFEERKLETRTHNKGIQKARESRRIPEERKEYLKSLRV